MRVFIESSIVISMSYPHSSLTLSATCYKREREYRWEKWITISVWKISYWGFPYLSQRAPLPQPGSPTSAWEGVPPTSAGGSPTSDLSWGPLPQTSAGGSPTSASRDPTSVLGGAYLRPQEGPLPQLGTLLPQTSVGGSHLIVTPCRGLSLAVTQE